MLKSNRQKALESLVNDEVARLTIAIYKWRRTFYEVLPYTTTLRRHNYNGFVKVVVGKETFMVREASNEVLQKYYPELWAKIELEKASHYNPRLVQH